MAQLVVRNIPDEVKERLKRRARQHGRSLEAEVRIILSQVPEPSQTSSEDDRNWVVALGRRMREIGVADEDIDALDAAIEGLRHDDRIQELES